MPPAHACLCCSGIMIKTKSQRVSVTAIAALALCSTANAARVKPIVDLSAATMKTQPAQPTAQKPAAKRTSLPEERALEFGGGGLALLLLAGGAWAVSHRKRRSNVWRGAYQSDEIDSAEPAPTPQRVDRASSSAVADQRSAFAWGNPPSATADLDAGGGERGAGETWVERAYRGPSPENPSLSLRKRLKRAAFFDKRERENAASVDTDAGLPERLIERAPRDEFEAA